MPLEPELVYVSPPFDFGALRQRGEDAAIAAVADLSMSEVCSTRTTIISRNCAKLHLQAPVMFLNEAAESVADVEGFVGMMIEAPCNDPSGIASLINSPALSRSMDFEIDVERRRERVVGYYGNLSVDAHNKLSGALSEYDRNICLTAEQIERSNSALPYILSVLYSRSHAGDVQVPSP